MRGSILGSLKGQCEELINKRAAYNGTNLFITLQSAVALLKPQAITTEETFAAIFLSESRLIRELTYENTNNKKGTQRQN